MGIGIPVHVQHHIRAAGEGVLADAGDGLGDGQGCQVGTVHEGVVANSRHALRDNEAGQAGAVEQVVADGRQACGQRHAGQVAAVQEALRTDGPDGVRNHDAGDRFILVEGGHADGGHGITLHHGGDGDVRRGTLVGGNGRLAVCDGVRIIHHLGVDQLIVLDPVDAPLVGIGPGIHAEEQIAAA